MKNGNLSTEHQAPGDARRPRDTLDRNADSTDYQGEGKRDHGRTAEAQRGKREERRVP